MELVNNDSRLLSGEKISFRRFLSKIGHLLRKNETLCPDIVPTLIINSRSPTSDQNLTDHDFCLGSDRILLVLFLTRHLSHRYFSSRRVAYSYTCDFFP